MNKPHCVDSVIIGAGPAGCAAAMRLVQADKQVVMLDAEPKQREYKIGESGTPSLRSILPRLNLEPELEKLGHLPCHGNRAVWGSPHVEEQDFLFKGMGHGWHLDRAEFDNWLRREAEQKGVTILRPAQLEDLGLLPSQTWGLKIEFEQKSYLLESRCLIDASGRAAVLAKKLGAQRKRLDELTALAIIATPSDDETLYSMSLVESCEQGWWYAAVIPNGQIIITLMTDADIVRELDLTNIDNYLALLEQTQEVQKQLKKPYQISTSVMAYPAHSGYLSQVAGMGWLAVGDAAIGLDPLTSSGIHCAMADGISGAEALIASMEGDKQAIPNYANNLQNALKQYLTERQTYYQRETRWADNRFWQRRQCSKHA
ncbi:tryptophan 7-halogenase [Candidatus Albibeggiatoa sp. nov. NOAA]|uniref:NAD(P)/FAD-dependent oxidoreductase n=1 Tax=Candidatus Albibeggiatoa sp. nov. NOAA TaxID=3162724 RepID=UPI0032F2123D|nr:tryptophan 7-halogenase [Thiotrichaceae bacterium]